MKVIIGIGNPEKRYENTRHNVGFYVLDAFAISHSVSFKKVEKFKANVAELTHKNEKVVLLKPTTYYNDSGVSARAVIDFYKLSAEDVLIIHDELALPFGSIRTRIGGSDAGNNGVKSLNAHLGDKTARIRIGVYNENRDRINDADFVLGQFTTEETKVLPAIATHCAASMNAFLEHSFKTTTYMI